MVLRPPQASVLEAGLTPRIDLEQFVVMLLLSGVLSYVLGWVYVRCGTSLSNRRQFGRNFMLLSMTTMLIITVVKSSLALSLGLVGALSIVRFRSAIKEPEELAYLFLAIAIGLGLGAGQWQATLLAFGVIAGILVARSRWKGADTNQNLYLTFSSAGGSVALEEVVATLREHCSQVNLRRFDESAELLEASFQVDFADFEGLTKGREALRRLDESVQVSLLENQSLA